MFTLKSVKGVFMDIRNFNNTNDINDFVEQVSKEQLSSEEQSKFEDLKGKYGADIDNLIDRFNGMSEGELITEVFKIINEKKRNGTFNPDEIDQLANIIAPMLNAEQRQKMQQLIDLIK